MKYLSMEFRRVFFSIKFCVGIIGVAFAQLMSIYKVAGVNTSVYTTYIISLYFIPYILSYMFCAETYAQSFCEDVEHSYIQQIMMRKNLKIYTISRVAFICLSAIITMVLGTIVFVIVVHIKVPWLSENDSYERDILAQFLFGANHYMLYFIIHSFFNGLVAALLSLLSAYASLFWRNRLLVLSIPVMSYCLLIHYSQKLFENIPQMEFSLMFNPSYNVWNQRTLSIMWPIGVSIMFISMMGILIYLKLRRMQYE